MNSGGASLSSASRTVVPYTGPEVPFTGPEVFVYHEAYQWMVQVHPNWITEIKRLSNDKFQKWFKGYKRNLANEELKETAMSFGFVPWKHLSKSVVAKSEPATIEQEEEEPDKVDMRKVYFRDP
jgi:hypothetical protein